MRGGGKVQEISRHRGQAAAEFGINFARLTLKSYSAASALACTSRCPMQRPVTAKHITRACARRQSPSTTAATNKRSYTAPAFSEEERAAVLEYAAAHPDWKWAVDANSELHSSHLSRYTPATVNRLLKKLKIAENVGLRTSLASLTCALGPHPRSAASGVVPTAMSEADAPDERRSVAAYLQHQAAPGAPPGTAFVPPITNLMNMSRFPAQPAPPAASPPSPNSPAPVDATIHTGRLASQANPGMLGYIGEEGRFYVLCIALPGWRGPAVTYNEHSVSAHWMFKPMSTTIPDENASRRCIAPIKFLRRWGQAMKASDTMAFTISGTLDAPPGHCIRGRSSSVRRAPGDTWLEFVFDTNETPASIVDDIDDQPEPRPAASRGPSV